MGKKDNVGITYNGTDFSLDYNGIRMVVKLTGEPEVILVRDVVMAMETVIQTYTLLEVK